jgi:CBS domain containing-hemolysin-like protein
MEDYCLIMVLGLAAQINGAQNLYNHTGEGVSTDFVMLIVYVLLALVFSFLCSIAEAVLLSITPSYIEAQKEKYPKRAAVLKQLKQENVDQSLAAILTLNTIAHTVGAVGSGAEAAIVFGSAWVGMFSAVMTLLILFFSEIVPKTIGAVYWSKLVWPTILFVKTLIIVLFPIVWVSQKLTRLISRGSDVHVFSKDEFIAMTCVVEETGQIGNKESRIIQNLFHLESLKVQDVMTPRTVISALPEDMKINDALEQVMKTPFSRLPLYNTDIDDITGFVLKVDVLISAARNYVEYTLRDLKRDILMVPNSISVSTLLRRFIKSHQHVAIVVDEYGGTDGLATLEDVVETFMSMEIIDEKDTVEDMRLLARKQWEERARLIGAEADPLAHRKAGQGNASIMP